MKFNFPLSFLLKSHQKFENDLLAYSHGELPPHRRAELQQHVEGCQTCRQELEIMQQLSTSLKQDEAAVSPMSTPEDKIGANLRQKILAKLPENSSTSSPPVRITPHRAPLVVWGAAAATVCVAAAVLFPTFSRSREDARRASSHSNLKQVGSGLTSKSEFQSERKVALQDDFRSAPIAGAKAPSNAPAASDSKTTKHLDGSNYAFSDGHTKWRNPSQEQGLAIKGANRISGESTLAPYRRVHKEGSLTVAVGNLESGSEAVETMIEKAGGFVANNSLDTQSDGLKTASLEIRIPVKQFDITIKQIAGLGKVKAKRVVGEDITAQVSDANEENNIVAGDLRIKLANYQRAKERAARKNKSLPDDWQQRADIRQMRVQLAQVRARLELLKKMSDYANLSVQLREKSTDASGGGFLGDIGKTSRAALDSLSQAARLPINLLIYILVYSPFWIPILLIWRHILRTNSRRLPEP